MSTTTENYKYTLPSVSENYSVVILNENFRKIDAAMKEMEDANSTIIADDIISGATTWSSEKIKEANDIIKTALEAADNEIRAMHERDKAALEASDNEMRAMHEADKAALEAADNEIRAALEEHKSGTILDHPDGCVITDKIADGAITQEKLDSDIRTAYEQDKAALEASDSEMRALHEEDKAALEAADNEIRAALEEHKSGTILDHPDGCVITDKIADGAITQEKLNSDLVSTINKKSWGLKYIDRDLNTIYEIGVYGVCNTGSYDLHFPLNEAGEPEKRGILIVSATGIYNFTNSSCATGMQIFFNAPYLYGRGLPPHPDTSYTDVPRIYIRPLKGEAIEYLDGTQTVLKPDGNWKMLGQEKADKKTADLFYKTSLGGYALMDLRTQGSYDSEFPIHVVESHNSESDITTVSISVSLPKMIFIDSNNEIIEVEAFEETIKRSLVDILTQKPLTTAATVSFNLYKRNYYGSIEYYIKSEVKGVGFSTSGGTVLGESITKIATLWKKEFKNQSGESSVKSYNINAWNYMIGSFELNRSAELNTALTAIADVAGDYSIEPLVEGVTEQFILKTSWSMLKYSTTFLTKDISLDVKYRLFAGDTPLTDTILDDSEVTVTAAGGFEGDNVTIRIYSNDTELFRAKLKTVNIFGKKIGRLVRI